MNSQPRFPTERFLALRLWPTWLMLGSLWLAARLPRTLRLRLGNLIGRVIMRISRHRRHITEVNLQLCFPQLSEAEREAMLRHHFESAGMMLIEMAMSWWLPDRALQGIADVEGLEHLEQAQADGSAVILLGAHFTTLEIGTRLWTQAFHFNVMYREHKNPLIEAVMRRARERSFERAIKRDDVRGMLRSLKQGVPVWYAPDQNYGREHSVFAPFFGIPAATIGATSRLAKLSGAKVVPISYQRLGDGRYRLYMEPALENFPSDDLQADATRINGVIERQVRETPAQYLWLHRRFKTRPEGEPGVY